MYVRTYCMLHVLALVNVNINGIDWKLVLLLLKFQSISIDYRSFIGNYKLRARSNVRHCDFKSLIVS